MGGALDFSRGEAQDAAMDGSAPGQAAAGELALLERSAFRQALGESSRERREGRRARGARVRRGGHRQERARAELLRCSPGRGAGALGCLRRPRHAAAAEPADRHRGHGQGPLAAQRRRRREAPRGLRRAGRGAAGGHADDRRPRGRALGRRGDARRLPAARPAGRGARRPDRPDLPRGRARCHASAASGGGRARHRAGRRPAAPAAALASRRGGARRARTASMPTSSTTRPAAIRSS